MLKLIYNDSQTELVKAAGGVMAQLVNFDKGVKSASAGFSKGVLEDFKPDKDHFAVHLIAVGDYENYGPNRNGDAFTKKANTDYHGCFVKFGHFFRHHKNTGPEHAIGIVKASCHNDDMGRIELIIHGCKKKAEEEYEMIKAGKSLPFSMSCKVSHDVCSICGHESPNRGEYCFHARDEMCKIYPNGKQAFVYNPQPYYFDISRVVRPADRIAWGLQTMVGPDNTELEKSASAEGRTLGGAELAKYAGISEPRILAAVGNKVVDAKKASIVKDLADLENKIDHLFATKEAVFESEHRNYSVLNEYPKAFVEGFENPITDDDMAKLASIDPSHLFSEMCDRSTIFNFPDFVRYIRNQSRDTVLGDASVKFAQSDILPKLFRKFGCELAHADTPFDGECSGTAPDEVQELLDSVTERHGFEDAKMRMVLASIDNKCAEPAIKSGNNISPDGETARNAETIAEFYGLYKLAMLARMDTHRLNEDLLTLSVLQNKMNP